MRVEVELVSGLYELMMSMRFSFSLASLMVALMQAKIMSVNWMI